MQPPIYIASSKPAAAVISLFFAAIAISILLMPCWIIWRLLLFGLLTLDYCRILRRYALVTSKTSVQSLQADCGKWLLQLANGKVYKASLSKAGTYSSGVLLILKFAYFGGVRSILVPRGAVSERNYRFLCLQIHNL